MMTTSTESRRQTRTTLIAAAVILLLLALVATLAHAADDAASRLDRKIRVMERVIDEVLAQSPNVVITSTVGVTRGLLLDDYGALFMFEGQLGSARDVLFARPARGIFLRGADDEHPSRRVTPSDEDEKIHLEKLEELDRKQEQEVKALEQKRTAQLTGLQAELIDTLIDYGPTLSELGDDQWVTIVAFLDGQFVLQRSDATQLVLRVRMKDLRVHASGGLSREGVARKVLVARTEG